MNLDINAWKPFQVKRLLEIRNGRGITKEEIDDNSGTFEAVQSGEDNNGVIGKISLAYVKKKKYEYTEKPCLTVARSGSAGFVSYHSKGCVVGDSAKILLLDDKYACEEVYLFIQTLLKANRFKYTYGRKVTEAKYMEDVIRLPIVMENDRSKIDKDKIFSDDGYMPNWEYMKNYIQSLKHKHIKSNNKPNTIQLKKTTEWNPFLLSDIFTVKYGINMELNACTIADEDDCESVNFVARTESNNGVTARVKLVEGKIPQEAGLITCAGGGSVLSTFLQEEPFYSGRDLYLLIPNYEMTKCAKLFCITVIKANKYRYSYGRQANITLPTLELLLPVKDNNEPDFEYMDKYIRELPYGDRIK